LHQKYEVKNQNSVFLRSTIYDTATRFQSADYVHGNKEIRHFLISATNEKMAQFIDELKGINSGARIDANFELLD